MATIVQNIETLNTIKNDIKKAINDKGVTVTDSDSFTLYASKIDQIKQGEGGGAEPVLESISITKNGIYTAPEGVDGYNEVSVNVTTGGDSTNYSYYDGSIDEAGLRAIGWDDESIGYLRDNALHYAWQNSDFVVSEENKALYGVITDRTTLDANRTNPNLEYLPMMGALPASQIMFFRGLTYLKALPKIDTSLCTDTDHLFQNCSNLLVIPHIDTSNVKSMYVMFDGCSKLKNIPLLDTSQVTYMGGMFNSCSSLETIPLLNTSNVTYMVGMFYYCTSLKSVPLLDTSKVTDMENMFNYCSKLETIPPLDTSKVTNMKSIFCFCSSLETIPLLNTSNVTNMYQMFYNCTLLKSVPLIDTSKVIDMENMFNSCSKLETIPLLNTSNVTNMKNMFYYCTSLKSVPLLDTSKVTDMYQMFYNCTKLESIGLLNFSSITDSSKINTFFGYSNITTLTDVGGFKDLKVNWNDNYSLAKLPNLTYESIMNVINNLYDFRANGETTTKTLKINSNTYALLSEEDFAVASNKGWTITK